LIVCESVQHQFFHCMALLAGLLTN
jgi:hypothetical protein